MTKGHLNSSHETIMEMAPGYFKRLWYNEEAYIREEGFEEAWERCYKNVTLSYKIKKNLNNLKKTLYICKKV